MNEDQHVEIERLRAEVERLQRSVDELAQSSHHWGVKLQEANADLVALRAELDETQAALHAETTDNPRHQCPFRAENEQLKRANVGLIADAVDIAYQRDQAWDEIEKLRAELAAIVQLGDFQEGDPL